MESLLAELAEIIAVFAPVEGWHPSPVPGVRCVRYTSRDRPSRRQWNACFAIVAQGCKEIGLGDELYRGGKGHYTATPIPLPVMSQVAEASVEEPFLALLIDLNPLILSEVAAGLGESGRSEAGQPVRALFRGEADERMLEAALRLARLFHAPEDARVLGPLVVRELFYHLLKGPEGAAIRQFVRLGSKMHVISQAVHALRAELSAEVDVPALAKTANMSRSAFFKHFKEVTAMSPIQYQKRLRLLEAKRLMMSEGETAENSAFKVGYKSVSQFSREYSRMFGDAPLRDVSRARELSSRAGAF